jgi:citrate/tricarballylate utilization protein
MSELQHLVDEARALASGEALQAEAVRQLQICNACRYCEGFCAVFPAMTRRLSFEAADLHYMANLCHNCGACLHACQYAPPHEFQVNIPKVMSQLRAQTYQDFAWPQAMGTLYRHNGIALTSVLVLALSLLLMWVFANQSAVSQGWAGLTFYDLAPHNTLVAFFAPVFIAAGLALAMGMRRFLREVTPATGGVVPLPAAQREAAQSALTLRYLDGGHGQGCNNEDDAYTHARRYAHHATFYGFALCFLATSVATLYHYLFGWVAPYAWGSLPKLLGVTGGVLLLIGASALLWLNLRRHPEQGDVAQRPVDRAFILLLITVSFTGLGLWLAKGSAALPVWLAVHLASVMVLFLTVPYGKMAHGFYRSAALLRYAVEKRLPSQLGLGGD